MAAAGVNWVVAQTYTVSKEALLEAIDICFEHGADVNATNSMGLTALLGAANRGSNEIIAKLAEHGADLYVRRQGRARRRALGRGRIPRGRRRGAQARDDRAAATSSWGSNRVPRASRFRDPTKPRSSAERRELVRRRVHAERTKSRRDTPKP